MATDAVDADQPRSYFARRLLANPAFAARCEAVAAHFCAEADAELKAVERSEVLGPKDFAIYINARAWSFSGSL